MIETGTVAALLALMAAVAVAVIRQRNLFAVVVLTAAYSFLMATALAALDAADVAMTEAAVGAGISTVLLLGALHLVGSLEMKPSTGSVAPLAIVIATGLLVAYGTYGLPAFSDPQSPIHRHVVPNASALSPT